MSTGITMGNVYGSYIVAATLSPASVAANTTAEQTFTVPGVRLNDVVFVNKPTAQAGLGIVGTRVSAADQIAITFSNNTASPIVPTASQSYLVYVNRPESATPRVSVGD